MEIEKEKEKEKEEGPETSHHLLQQKHLHQSSHQLHQSLMASVHQAVDQRHDKMTKAAHSALYADGQFVPYEKGTTIADLIFVHDSYPQGRIAVDLTISTDCEDALKRKTVIYRPHVESGVIAHAIPFVSSIYGKIEKEGIELIQKVIGNRIESGKAMYFFRLFFSFPFPFPFSFSLTGFCFLSLILSIALFVSKYFNSFSSQKYGKSSVLISRTIVDKTDYNQNRDRNRVFPDRLETTRFEKDVNKEWRDRNVVANGVHWAQNPTNTTGTNSCFFEGSASFCDCSTCCVHQRNWRNNSTLVLYRFVWKPNVRGRWRRHIPRQKLLLSLLFFLFTFFSFQGRLRRILKDQWQLCLCGWRFFESFIFTFFS